MEEQRQKFTISTVNKSFTKEFFLGLASGLMDKKGKLVNLISSITQPTSENLKISYSNQKTPYFSFIREMKRVSDRVDGDYWN